MTKPHWNILTLSLLLLAALLTAHGNEVTPSFTLGQAQARHDLSNGVVKIKTYGLPMPWSGDYAALVKKRTGAEIQPVAGCAVDQDTIELVRGYNQISRDFLGNKFGTNIFAELETAARQAWDEKLSSPKAQPDIARTHKIQPGDTLLTIARKKHVTVKALAAANPGINASKLRIGQVLQVPPATIKDNHTP
jgi:stage V sporulation protein SpoVS